MLMVVMTPRETSTDQRLDTLEKRLDRVDADLRELRGEVRDLGKQMSARFESLDHKLIGAAVVLIAALIGSNATLVGVALF